MLKQLIIASLAVACVAGASAQAQAQESDTRTVKVSVVGIDTRTESGALVVLHRIKFAAAAVCSPPSSHPLDRDAQNDPCVRRVTERTVAGLNNPYLTALMTRNEPAQRLASAR
jgi:UrcA family protein